MARNIGYLKANKTATADECYTPAYAVVPVIEYLLLNKFKIIWCPFDDNTSQFVKILKKYNFKVINTHLANGKDFFKIKPPKKYDVIVSNPPYSIKDKVIAKCYQLNKPFMLLMPLPTLQGKYRFQYFQQGLELLVFDGRISYFTNNNTSKTQDGNSFASVYFCRNVLPEKLIFKKLDDYKKLVANKKINTVCETDSQAILKNIKSKAVS